VIPGHCCANSAFQQWEPLSPTGLLFTPQMIYEYAEPRWHDIDTGKLKNSDRNLSQCHFVHRKSHLDCLGTNLDFRTAMGILGYYSCRTVGSNSRTTNPIIVKIVTDRQDTDGAVRCSSLMLDCEEHLTT
jgi:hypothetical protein